MSDIGIPGDPVSIIAIILLLGSPGFLLGAIPGATLAPSSIEFSLRLLGKAFESH
jgi:hypothetical protein